MKNKKAIIITICLIVCIAGLLAFLFLPSNKEEETIATVPEDVEVKQENTPVVQQPEVKNEEEPEVVAPVTKVKKTGNTTKIVEKEEEDTPSTPIIPPKPVKKPDDFAEYLELTVKEKEAFSKTFNNFDDFLNWFESEREKYIALNPAIESDGNLTAQ